MFGASRIVIPHLRREGVPDILPKSMVDVISRLKKRHKSKDRFLQAAYKVVTDRFIGKCLGMYRYFNRTVCRDIHKIWNTPGVQACTIQNFVLRTMLVRSGLFDDKDVVNVHSIFGCNIHQFLKINVGKKWVFVDPWGRYNNIPFGEYGGWRVTAKVKEAVRKVFKAS